MTQLYGSSFLEWNVHPTLSLAVVSHLNIFLCRVAGRRTGRFPQVNVAVLQYVAVVVQAEYLLHLHVASPVQSTQITGELYWEPY